MRECWLVHLEGMRIEVIEFRSGVLLSTVFTPYEVLRSPLLPGFRVMPGELMRYP